MISQILLDEVVESFVPKEYNPAESKYKNIIAINCVSPSKIRGIRQAYYPDSPIPKGFIGAMALDLGDVYSEKKYSYKYIMYVSEDIEDKEELAFILLNQIGYIDLYLNFSNRDKIDETLYVDFFAVNILSGVLGSKKAKELAVKYSPIKGE